MGGERRSAKWVDGTAVGDSLDEEMAVVVGS